MRILHLAFIESSFRQLLVKTDQQHRVMKRLNPETSCFVIGVRREGTITDDLSPRYIELAGHRDALELRLAHFAEAEKLVQSIQPDVIYLRYPFFDGPALEFAQRHGNIVYEIQTIAANEVGPRDAGLERHFGPPILGNALGIVAVTKEILDHELARSPRPLPGYVMSNGIDPESLSFIETAYPADAFHFLVAANFSPWHGIDRLLKGLARFPRSGLVHIHLAGGGSELPKYRSMVQSLGLERQVTFHGMLDQPRLEALSRTCHVGVGSLALHRLGLTEFCILKNREYCLRGIPFIYAGRDVDFVGDLPFRRSIPSDEQPVDIEPFLALAEEAVRNPAMRIQERRYAEEHLSWGGRMTGLLQFFGSIRSASVPSQPPGGGVDRRGDDPLVSVVIPCYRQAQFLREAVGSVVAQSYARWECIVVNDGSPDECNAVVRDLIAENPSRSIRLITQENGGLSRARNAGIAAAHGAFVIPLDADDKLEPGFIGKTLAVLRSHPEVGFVYSHIRHFGERQDCWELPEFDARTIVEVDNTACVCSLLRKEMWKQVGGYNERMRDGYEDWDFWVGCIEKGWKGYRIPEPLFCYRIKPQSMLKDSNKKRQTLIAAIIMNHQGLYDGKSREWAASILGGENVIRDRTSRPLTITYLINSILGVTGGNQTLLRQANALVARGHTVTIVTQTEAPAWFPLKAHVIRVPEGKPMSAFVPESDVAISTYFLNTRELRNVRAAVKIYFAQGDQFVFEDSSVKLSSDGERIRRALKDRSRESYLEPGVRFVPNSRALAAAVEQRHGRTADAILPVCVDRSLFRPFPRATRDSRLRILVVGPDVPGTELEPLTFKGIADIRAAVEILTRSGLDFTLVRIANSERHIFKEFPCEFYIAPGDELKTFLYGTANLLVYASHYDSCPRPPLEAMASGAAVVCTSTAGALEYCRDGENCLLVPPGSPADLAAGMERVIRDLPLREQLITGGLATAAGLPQEREWNELEQLCYRFLRESPAGGAPVAHPPRQKSVDALLGRAYELFAAKKFQDALAVADEILPRLDDLAEVRSNIHAFRGLCFLEQNFLERARSAFAEGLSDNPASVQACIGLGRVFFKSGDYEASRRMFAEGLKIEPGNAQAAEGIRAADSERESDAGNGPRHPEQNPNPAMDLKALLGEVHALLSRRDFNGALDRLALVGEQIEDLTANHPEVLAAVENLKGLSHLGLNRLDEARMSFEHALKADPQSSPACAGLGQTFTAAGLLQEAKTMFEWGVRNDPNNATAVAGLAGVNRSLGLPADDNALAVMNG